MVHDPLVIERLLPYGFDLRSKYDREARLGIGAMSQFDPALLKDRDLRMPFMIRFVSNALDWERLRRDNEPTTSEFPNRFQERFPDVAAEGRDLLALVREVGFDTPQRMAALFEEVIKRYGLANSVGCQQYWKG